ncbi:MAG: SIMPL domain-containing protein [Candidatus Pacebacteria bacterium]|nr:SIMPL domain-containing protein [Candidatus Paceibacterota bacterium]MDD3919006.1 SIMPL domain-containing protein [Candidatus Paceibacterota bacterium]
MENILNNKLFKNLINVFIGVLIIFLAFIMFNLSESKEQNTISVTGFAEISAKPDVAQITLTVISENIDLGIASNQNSERINAIVSFLEENGVESKDIKTSLYNISPRYEYVSDYSKRYLASYEVEQSLTVKIRNLDIVGDIIAGATERGSNDISSLQFIIDDDEALKEEVRGQAIANAKEKAEILGKDLGVSLTEIVNFYETSSSPIYSDYNYTLGGAGIMESAKAISSSIQAGENNITSNVTIVYKIK